MTITSTTFKSSLVRALVILTFSISVLLQFSCKEEEPLPETNSPLIQIVQPSNGSVFEEAAGIDLRFKVSDLDDDLRVVEIFWDNDFLEYFRETGTIDYHINTLGKLGDHEIRLEAHDSFENKTIVSVRVEIVETAVSSRIVEISEVLDINATILYEIESNDLVTLKECGLCWSEKPSPTIDDFSYSDTTDFGVFEMKIGRIQGIYDRGTIHGEELLSHKEYHVRPYVKSNLGTFYGEGTTFKTPKLGFQAIQLYDSRFQYTCFIEPNTIITKDQDNILYISEDSGGDWQYISDIGYLDYLYFMDKQKGFSINEWEEQIVMTLNGGYSWQEVNQHFPEEFSDFFDSEGIFFCDNDFGYTIVRNTDSKGDLAVTYDGGYNWHFLNKPSSLKKILHASFYSSSIGIIYGWRVDGGGNALYFTADGGDNWTDITKKILSEDDYVMDIQFFSRNECNILTENFSTDAYKLFTTDNLWNSVRSIELKIDARIDGVEHLNNSEALFIINRDMLYSFDIAEEEWEYHGSSMYAEKIKVFSNKTYLYDEGYGSSFIYYSDSGMELIYDW